MPRGFAHDRLEPASGDALGLFGGSARPGRTALVAASRLHRIGRGLRLRGEPDSRRPSFGDLAVEGIRLAGQARGLRAAFEHRIARPEAHAEIRQHRRPVARRDRPARGQRRLDRETGSEVGQPRGPGEEPASRARRVPADGGVERPATGGRERLAEPALARVVGRGGTARPFGDDERATLGGERPDRVGGNDVRPGHRRQGRLGRGTQRRIDREVLVQPAATDSSGRAGDAACLVLGKARLQAIELRADGRSTGAGRDGPLMRGGAGSLRPTGRVTRRLQGRRRLALRLDRIRKGRAGTRELRLQSGASLPALGRLGSLLGGTALDLGKATSGGVAFSLARGGSTAQGRELLALRLLRAPQCAELR